MERLVRWCRRNPVVAGLAATGLFILVAGVIVSSIFAVEAGHRAESESKARIAAQKSEGEANRARKDVEDKKKELERREYVHRVALANYEWERNNIESAISLLENAPKEWRGWEWYCLRRRCNVVLRTIGSLPAPIIVAYSPDGKSLAALSLGNGQVKLWNPTTGAQIWQTTIPNLNGRSRVGQGFPLVFTPDGQRIAVGSIGGAIHILDATTGKEMTAWHGPGTTVLTLAVSPDGMWLASFSLQPEDPQDWGGGPGHILIWSMRAGTVVHDLKMPNHYIDLAFSPDSKNLAAAGVHNDTVGIWDVATGKLAERQLAGDSISASSVAYSPDGKLFAAARGDRIRIWDLATGRSITTLTGHSASVRQVLFTADSQRIVTASTDNSAKVWDLATSREVTTIRGNGRPLHSISLRPNSNELATSCDDWSIRTFDMDKSRGMFVSRPDGGLLSALSFHPGGRRIVDGNGFNLESWDPVSGRQLPTLGVGHMEAVFNTDGKQLAIGGSHYLESRPTVRLVDAESGKELKTLGRHKANVLHIAYSRDGSKIASNSEDRVLKIWNADSGEELRTIPNVLSAAMSPDGTQVATGNDKGVRLFEISSGNEIRSMPGQKYGVISLAFSPDGSRLVSGAHDRTGRVWDVATGQPIFQLDTHTNAVTCVAFSPDGRRLATASSDRTVKIWNAVNGDELLTLRGPSDVITKLEFSPDGNRVAVASGDSCLYIWDGTPIPEPKVK
jgi:WD40 repeat protein